MFLIYFVFPKKVHLQDDFEISKTVKSYRKDSFVFLNIFWIYNISLYSKRHYLYDILKKKVWNHHLAMESSSSNGITIYCLKKEYRMLFEDHFRNLVIYASLRTYWPFPSRSQARKKLTEIFIFILLWGTSKGFMQELNAFIKLFEAPQRSLKIKI